MCKELRVTHLDGIYFSYYENLSKLSSPYLLFLDNVPTTRWFRENILKASPNLEHVVDNGRSLRSDPAIPSACKIS